MKHSAVKIPFLRLYGRFLNWLRNKYNPEIMCMASALLFTVKGGLLKAIPISETRTLCISERNLDDTDKTSWSDEARQVWTGLYAEKTKPLYDWELMQAYMLDQLVRPFLQEVFPSLSGELNKADQSWARTLANNFGVPFELFSRSVPETFDVHSYLSDMSRILPNLTANVVGANYLSAWNVRSSSMTAAGLVGFV